MAASKPEMTRVLLSPCEDGAGRLARRDNMVMALVEVYPGLEPKIGHDVLKFRGYTNPGGNGRGDFILSKNPPGHLLYLGAWVYLAPDSNVSQVGLGVTDAEGENLAATVPADWQGWKWVEFSTEDAAFQPVNPKETKNGKVDFPLQNVHFVWSSPRGGTNFVGVDGLAAVAQPDPGDKSYTVEITSSDVGEANAPFHGQAVVNNFSDKPVDVDVHYSIQTNPLLYNRALPDPVLGADRAFGCKNWIEVDGKRIDDDSLTTDEPDTCFSTDRLVPNAIEEFQFLDLGQERTITALRYWSNETAGRQHKVDFSASDDGKTYAPVDGLQKIDIHGKWGGPYSIPVPKPFKARFLRLRYHNDGNKFYAGDHGDFIAFCALSKLYVYDGLKPGELDIPHVGTLVEEKTAHISAPPHSYALLPLDLSTRLKTGSYYFGTATKTPDGTELNAKGYFARSAQEVKIGPASRFGVNSAIPGAAEQLKRLGVGWVRFENMNWSLFNDAPEEFNYERTDNIPLDTSLSLYHQAGLSILPYIQRTPLWATSAPPENNRKDRMPPKDDEDYGKALFETAARYGSTTHPESDLHTADKKSGLGWVSAYELWNEPNNPPDWGDWAAPMDQYFSLFRAGAEGVKRGDPKAKVALAGLSGLPMDLIDTLRTHKFEDGKSVLDFTDILGVHRYVERQEPEWWTPDPRNNLHGEHSDEVVTFEKEMRDLADWRDYFKPTMSIWLTETGVDVDGPMGRTERIQAAKVPRALMLGLANGMDKVFLYRDVGSTVTWHNHFGTGVIRDDNTLRPSYFALATLTRELDGVTDLRTPRLRAENPKVWLYNWNRGKDHVLTAWTPEGTEPLGLDLGKCHVTDAFGMESDVDVKKDFPLTIYPVYITQIANAAPIAKLETEAVAREAQRKKTWAFLADKAHLYLFDFGMRTNKVSHTFGLPRAITALEAGDAYDAQKGYGFLGKDGKSSWEPWNADDPIDKGWVSFPGDGFQFQIDAAPGMYDLDLKVVAAPDGAKLTVTGAQGGDVTVPLVNAGIAHTQIIASKQPLVIKVPADIRVQWLTLVQRRSETP